MSMTRRAALASSSLLAVAGSGDILPVQAETGVPSGPSSSTPSAAQTVADPGVQLMYRCAIGDPLVDARHERCLLPGLLFREFGMKAGDVIVKSKPLVARHEVVTA